MTERRAHRQRFLRLLALPWIGLAVFTAVTALGSHSESVPVSEPFYPATSVLDADPVTQGITLPEELEHLARGEAPRTLEELKQLERYLQTVTPKLLEATVAVRVWGAQGSGVIVSPDGYVLTAAHVVGRAGRSVRVIMNDGEQHRGTSLGADFGGDAALIKLEGDGPYPFVEWGESSSLPRGSWCIASGHPGGFDLERGAPLRFGRVIRSRRLALHTDCTLVGGDSGGPLFDLNGRVVGIHSRIQQDLRGNFHVPVDLFRAAWEKLRQPVEFGNGFLGVRADRTEESAQILSVVSGSAADRAGMKAGDRVVEFGGQPVESWNELVRQIRETPIELPTSVVVERDGARVELTVQLDAR